MEGNGSFPLTGVAYVSQIEHEYMNLHKLSVCAQCFALGLNTKLRRCNACRLVDYCSKECQKAHWRKHKPFCNMAVGKGAKNAYLSSFNDKQDLFQVLVDSYRLRVEVDHRHRGEDHGIYSLTSQKDKIVRDGETASKAKASANEDDQTVTGPAETPAKAAEGNLVWSTGDAVDDFQEYMGLAESSGVLPKWWTSEERLLCLYVAIDKDDHEENIFASLNHEELITRYSGDTSIRSALSILAELVVGYEGKGRAMDDRWFAGFREYMDLHPEERAKLIQDTVNAVKVALESTGHNFNTEQSS